MKSTSFKILILFASIAYALMIITNIAHEWDDLKMGFIEGYTTANSEKANQSSFRTYFLTVSPFGSVLNFPDRIVNMKTNQEINSRYYQMRILMPEKTKLPFRLKLYNGIQIILSFFLLAIYIFIPFQFYRLMNDVNKGKIFEKETIKIFSRIGVSLLLFYFALGAFNLISYEIKTSLFSFEHYQIERDITDVIWFVLGLVFMIISEVFTRGIKMKEEQELTI